MTYLKKQAICIQCHDKPELVNSLIRILPEKLFDIFIHVDKKSSMIDKIDRKSNVFLCQKRIDVRWGQYSQIEATISMLKMFDPLNYTYVHLISGQDYIIKKPSVLYDFFSATDKEYIGCTKLPEDSAWSGGGVGSLLSLLSVVDD